MARLNATLRAVSPQATLERGYAIVTVAGGTRLVRSHAELDGDEVDIRLARERFRAQVRGWEPVHDDPW